jgi:hypothetical protein
LRENPEISVQLQAKVLETVGLAGNHVTGEGFEEQEGDGDVDAVTETASGTIERGDIED